MTVNTPSILIPPLLLLSFLLFPGGVLGQCDEPLVLGWETWEPYQFLDDGELTGFDIEVITAIVEDMGCELGFVKRPWKRLLDDLREGSVHLVAGAFYHEDREQFAWISPPYRREKIALWVTPNRGHSFTALSDLAGTVFRLGVTRGYYYGQAFGRLLDHPDFPSDQLIEVADTEDLLPMMVRGRIDGFLADEIYYTRFLRTSPLSDQVERHHMTVNEEDTFVLMSRAAVPTELAESFNRSFRKLRQNGTFDRLSEKYLE